MKKNTVNNCIRAATQPAAGAYCVRFLLEYQSYVCPIT